MHIPLSCYEILCLIELWCHNVAREDFTMEPELFIMMEEQMMDEEDIVLYDVA